MLLRVRLVDVKHKIVICFLCDVGTHGPSVKDEHSLQLHQQAGVYLLSAKRLIALRRFEEFVKQSVPYLVLVGVGRLFLQYFLNND